MWKETKKGFYNKGGLEEKLFDVQRWKSRRLKLWTERKQVILGITLWWWAEIAKTCSIL